MQCIICFVYFVWSQWHSQLYFEIDIPVKVSHFQILAADFLKFGIKMTVLAWFSHFFIEQKSLKLGSFELRNLEVRRKSCEDRKDWWKWTCEEVREYFRRFRSSFVIYCSISTLNYTLSYTPLATLTLKCAVTTCRGRHHHHLTEGVELAYEDN